MKRFIYIPFALLLSVILFGTSCSDDLPESREYPYATQLLSLKITNAIVNGEPASVEGTLDVSTMTISFPRLDSETDFANLRFEAITSDGASLKGNGVFNFAMAEEDAEKTSVFTVINHNRYTEYFVTVRKNIPVWGADFSKMSAYEFSDASGNKYDKFTGELTRGAGFDGEHVLVVSRLGFSVPGQHLLKISDLMQGLVQPIDLSLIGVVGGTLVVNTGAEINGHTYVINIAGAAASPLKIYHYASPTSEPEIIYNATGHEGRFGNSSSIDLDENGNGYIFMQNNTSDVILRLKVTNYTTIDPEYTYINGRNENSLGFSNMHKVENENLYVYSGRDMPIMIMSDGGSISYTAEKTSFVESPLDPRVFYFNNERYLMVMSAAIKAGQVGTLYVYDITKGSTVEEALQIFESGENKQPVFSRAIGGNAGSAYSANTGYKIIKDEAGKDKELMIFGARTDAGFSFFKFPIKTQD